MKLNTACNEIEPNIIVECVSWQSKKQMWKYDIKYLKKQLLESGKSSTYNASRGKYYL